MGSLTLLEGADTVWSRIGTNHCYAYRGQMASDTKPPDRSRTAKTGS
jgi:hypothetical protein